MNKVILIGHAGRDPEMTYTPNGNAVTKFTLAVSRKWTDKTTGEKKDETTWFNIVAWDKVAETCSQFLHKGDQVYVEGRFVSRTYKDKDGIERRAFEVVLETLELLSANKKNTETAPVGATSSPF